MRLFDGKFGKFEELPESWHKHLLKVVKMEEKAMEGREAIFDSKYEDVSYLCYYVRVGKVEIDCGEIYGFVCFVYPVFEREI